MEDDNSKGVVLKGPWKRAKSVKKSQTEKISNDMAFAEDVAESVMIPMIHGLGENGVDIKSDKFVAEIGFINEVVKAIVYRTMNYPHPMLLFIEAVMSTKKESVEDVYSKFDYEKIEEMLGSLEKDDGEDDK